MDSLKSNQHIDTFMNSALTDLKSLTSTLGALSKSAAQNNNALINRMLLGTDRDALELTKALLTHLLRIAQLKGLSALIMSILVKTIAFLKAVTETQTKDNKNEEFEIKEDKKTQKIEAQRKEAEKYEKQGIAGILSLVLEVLGLMQNKQKEGETAIRIVQTAFSMIDSSLLVHASHHILTRLYALCFHSCETTPNSNTTLVYNISLSALFALTEVNSLPVLAQLLQFVVHKQRLPWIKHLSSAPIVWELVIIAIKNLPKNSLYTVSSHPGLLVLLNQLYKQAIDRVFRPGELPSPDKNKAKKDTGSLIRKDGVGQFICGLKCFVYLSLGLSVRAQKQLVPFRESLGLFRHIYELQRANKAYLLLEAMTILLLQGYNWLIEQQRGIVCLEIISKITQQICLQGAQVSLLGQGRELYLQGLSGELSKVTDTDFVLLIKQTMIKLRKAIQGSGDLWQGGREGEKRRWQRLIRVVISIIRYLTSMKVQLTVNEPIIRKLIIQLQYWFLLCPSHKTRNLILQQLASTATHVESRAQAIKASQCLQLGCNLVIGYYELIDTHGLAAVIAMTSTLTVSWQSGQGQEELEEVCLMADKLYQEQRLVQDEASFRKSLQAITQCINTCSADLQLNSKGETATGLKIGKEMFQRNLKELQFLLSKLQITLTQNMSYLNQEWSFLNGFWISLCSQKSTDLQQSALNHLRSILPTLLRAQPLSQSTVLSCYLQLAKLEVPFVSKIVAADLRTLLQLITSEEGIIQVWRILVELRHKNQIGEPQSSETRIMLAQTRQSLEQMQEMLVKEFIFKIKSSSSVKFVLNCLQNVSADKNQEYRTVSLIWNVSDHIKSLQCRLELWQPLFRKLLQMSQSPHGQTRQTCMHTFTQILAQSTQFLPKKLFYSLVQQIYLPLFYMLLGLNQHLSNQENAIEHSQSNQDYHFSNKKQNKSDLTFKLMQTALQAQTCKIAIKNFLKIVKKIAKEDIGDVEPILIEINNRLIAFLRSKNTSITVEYCLELCLYLEYFRSQPKQQNTKSKSKQEEQTIQQQIVAQAENIDRMLTKSALLSTVRLILQAMQVLHEQFDKSTVLWRKKYEPLYLNLKQNIQVQ